MRWKCPLYKFLAFPYQFVVPLHFTYPIIVTVILKILSEFIDVLPTRGDISDILLRRWVMIIWFFTACRLNLLQVRLRHASCTAGLWSLLLDTIYRAVTRGMRRRWLFTISTLWRGMRWRKGQEIVEKAIIRWFPCPLLNDLLRWFIPLATPVKYQSRLRRRHKVPPCMPIFSRDIQLSPYIAIFYAVTD